MKNRIVIGDVHLNNKYKIYFTNILFPFLRQICNKYNFDEVVFLGDIFHSSNLNNEVSKLFKELITIFKEKEIKIVNGNHDKINLKENVYDLFLLPSNITIHHDLYFEENHIYLPHMKSIDINERFNCINDYINDHDFEEFYIYSHNDYSEMYSFRNTFSSLFDNLNNHNKTCYFINGHNHVPVFKFNEEMNLHVLNIGCAISLDFKDSGLYNYFLHIDDKVNILYNDDSIQHITLNIFKEEDVEEKIEELNDNNFKFLKFKIYDPSIAINRDDIIEKNDKKIIDFIIDYDLSELANIANNSSVTDKEKLYSLMEKLDISVDEFVEFNDAGNLEKINVLFSILDIMFSMRKTEEENKTEVVNIIKKYLKSNE